GLAEFIWLLSPHGSGDEERTTMKFLTYVAAGALVVLVAGCTAHQSSDSTTAASGASTTTSVPIPPNSPLAKVHVGMSKPQVKEILGPATDENSYLSGKAWIPFYFGNDARLSAWFYKGMGRVVF